MIKKSIHLVKTFVGYFRVHRKINLLKTITNPFLISALLSIIMIIIIPPIFNKYNVAIQNQHSIIPEVTYYYADLNSDGRSEEIEFRQIRENYLGVTVREKEKVINEWNFEGKFIKSKNTLIAKADNDSISSIYFLSFENNKLFLNCLNPFENKILF